MNEDETGKTTQLYILIILFNQVEHLHFTLFLLHYAIWLSNGVCGNRTDLRDKATDESQFISLILIAR